MSEEMLISETLKLQKQILKLTANADQNQEQAMDILRRLDDMNIPLQILISTRIPMTVNGFRVSCKDKEVKTFSKTLLKKWKHLNDTANISNRLQKSNNENAQKADDKNEKEVEKIRRKHLNETTNTGNNLPKCNDETAQKADERNEKEDEKMRRKHLNNTANTSNSVQKCNDENAQKANEKNENEKEEHVEQNKEKKKNDKKIKTAPNIMDAKFRVKCKNDIIEALCVNENLEEKNIKQLVEKLEECVFRKFNNTGRQYRYQMLSRFNNLSDPKNPDLRRKFISGRISPACLAVLSHEEMASDAKKRVRATYRKEFIDESSMPTVQGTTTSILKCGKCKKRNCSYNELQTRSADEPMTTFAYCNDCGHRWKF